MSAPKHTPGPWQWFKGGRGGFVFFAVSEVANLTPAYVADNSAAADTMQANAYLIAAAPDLLEALKEVVDVLDMLMLVRDVQPQEGSPAFKARAAIAKAEGGAA